MGAMGRPDMARRYDSGPARACQQKVGDGVMSGATNVGEELLAITTGLAAESTYAGLVRLVEAAQRSRAPMSRLADRYAMGFLAATIALAGAAWVWSADPIRAVAVLVVATPCPLILAVPVAIVSGLSRAAKHGIQGRPSARDFGAGALAGDRQDRHVDARSGTYCCERCCCGRVC